MVRFNEWIDAREHALKLAHSTGLNTAIRAVKEFGKHGFNVGFAARNDSDYARAEVVRPTDNI